MYLPHPPSELEVSFGTGVADVVHRVVVHLAHVISVLHNFIVRCGHRLGDWGIRVAVALVPYLHIVFQLPSEWAVSTFHAFNNFLHMHPHIAHLICWAIFFGPIVVLLPFLIVYELVFSVLFNLSFISHGLIPGTVDEQYGSLKEAFLDRREPLFAVVENVAAKYNHWTTLCLPLIAVRLVAAALALYVTYGIWTGW